MMESINPGTNPGNETRIRNLERTVQDQNQRINTMLSMLKHGQRFSGGGSGGINLIIARASEDVHNTSPADPTFAATIVTNLIGSATLGASITVKNLDMGYIQRPDLSYIIEDGDEYVFALLTGMKFIAILCDDGEWQILQSGGVLEDYSWYSSGGPVPETP